MGRTVDWDAKDLDFFRDPLLDGETFGDFRDEAGL